MSPDDIDSLVVHLSDFLVKDLGCAIDENEDFEALLDFMHNALEPYVKRDRNYN